MTTVKIKGMSCQHCVASTKKALEAIEGVSNVAVDLDNGAASFDGTIAPDVISQAITAIGFEVIQE
jgi:copper chaperone